MRLAVLADVHGNRPALEAVLADLHGFRPDGLIVAGDYVGGPHPDETIALLLGIRPNWLILGNSDLGLLRFLDGKSPAYQRFAKQFALLRWACQRIKPDSVDVLRRLPETLAVRLDGPDAIRVVHGKLDNAFDGYDPAGETQALISDVMAIEEKVLICGHTHRPWIFEVHGRLALNPGSVAGPLNGYRGAQYARLEWIDGHWQAELHAIEYDLSLIRSDFLNSGQLAEGGPLARCFLNSIESGEDDALHFLSYARELAGAAGYRDHPFIPDEIWDRAESTYDWVKFRPN